MLIEGMYVPLTMPFARDGESYLHKLEYNVARYSLGPAAGLVAFTSVGEGGALSDAETCEAFSLIGATAAKEKVLVAAIARESVRNALAIAEKAAENGFDAALLGMPPTRERLSHAEKTLYIHSVADRSPLPLLLHGDLDDPQSALALDDLQQLAQHWNIIGVIAEKLTLEQYAAIAAATRNVKRETTVTPVFAPVTRRMQRAAASDSSGSVSFVTAESLAGGKAVAIAPSAPAIKTRVKSVGFQVMLGGSAQGFVELLEAGVAGGMLTLSACAPQVCHEAYAAFKDGDPALAAEKGHRLLEADASILPLGVAAVKYGCDLNGYYGGVPRLPRVALDREQRLLVERVLAGIKN